MQKGFAEIVVIIAVLLLAAIGGAYYLGTQKNKSTDASPAPVAQTSPTPDASQVPNGNLETANWKTYTNSTEGYSIKYPPDWIQTEQTIEEDKGGHTDPIKRSSWVDFKNESSFPQTTIAVEAGTNVYDKTDSGDNKLDPEPISETIVIKVAGYEGQQTVDIHAAPLDTVQIFTFVTKGNKEYGIHLIGGLNKDDKNYPALRKIYEQMLSTFRFE